MNNGREKKKKYFIKKTIEDYYDNVIIDNDYLKITSVLSDDIQHIENFKNIGIKPYLDGEIFNPSGNYHPFVIGLIRGLVLKERDYFLSSILQKEDVETISTSISDLTLPKLMGIISGFDANIFIPLHVVKYWLTNNEWKKLINFFSKPMSIINLYNFFTEPTLTDDIILIDKNFNSWTYAKFHNDVTNKDERIDIRFIEDNINRVQVILRTLNYLLLDSDYIKIIHLID